MSPSPTDLASFTDAQLLAELIRRNGLQRGPERTVYVDTVMQTLVSIDPDHTATIRMHTDDVDALAVADAA